MTRTVRRSDGMSLDIEPLDEDIIHITGFGLDGPIEPLMKRYGLIADPPASTSATWTDGVLMLGNGYTLSVADDLCFSLHRNGKPLLRTLGGAFPGTALTYHQNRGYRWETSVGADERLVGFGDHQRDAFLLNGRKGRLWVRYNVSNIPVTFYLSSYGYGVVFNTTRRLYYDFGSGSPGRASFRLSKDYMDIYIIPGSGYEEIIRKYTLLAGRPTLPPQFSFGLWLICQEKIRAHELLQVAQEMRRAEIPCDILSLEPGWMETRYDLTTGKNWHPDRFPSYPWADKGPQTFINALKSMGYHFGLWTCCDWDFTWEEERRARNAGPARQDEDDATIVSREEAASAIDDQRQASPAWMDKITRPDEAWFEHLKKFVDQGVDFFKLDGCEHGNPHPDRLYGNGRTDEEMHNLNFVLYSRQMIMDFEAHTGRRGFVLSSHGWTGFQRLPGTWAGDTGTGPAVVCGMLQTSLVGHSCTTCDMEIDSPQDVHMGLLLPWAHINSWDYFRYPFYRGECQQSMFRDYMNLRMRLLPFYYSLAWTGTQTGMPIMRPMLLVYPDREEAYHLTRQFLLGDSLLVNVFGKTLTLPDCEWFDWWTNSVLHGDWEESEPSLPQNRGGHLLVRSGAVFPMREVQQHAGQTSDQELTWVVFPGRSAGRFTLYLDNGLDLSHRRGAYAAAEFVCEPGDGGWTLRWGPVMGNEPSRIKDLRYDIELLALPASPTVSIDGRTVQADQDPARNRHMVRGVAYGQVVKVHG